MGLQFTSHGLKHACVSHCLRSFSSPPHALFPHHSIVCASFHLLTWNMIALNDFLYLLAVPLSNMLQLFPQVSDLFRTFFFFLLSTLLLKPKCDMPFYSDKRCRRARLPLLLQNEIIQITFSYPDLFCLKKPSFFNAALIKTLKKAGNGFWEHKTMRLQNGHKILQFYAVKFTFYYFGLSLLP